MFNEREKLPAPADVSIDVAFLCGSGAWYGIDLAWHLLFAIDVLVHLNTGFVDGASGKVNFFLFFLL